MIICKTITATISAIALAATLAATATPAEARYGRNAGIFGVLAATALVAGAIAASSAPACSIESRPVVNRWGDVVGYRRVRVCD